MNVTVIIPTLRRPEVVTRAVRGALEQLEEGDSCLVVVQGNEQDRAATRRAISIWLGGPEEPDESGAPRQGLRIIDQPEPSLTAARNRGLLMANTPYVAFLDDDAVPRRNWLSELLRPLREDRADLVAGRLCEVPNLTTNDPDRVGAVLTWTGHTRRNYDADRSGPSGLAPGGNMAVRRDLAIRAGGFDPHFTGAALYEDVEFSERLRNLSARVWYCAEAAVDHLAVRTGDWWAQESAVREAERARHMSAIFSRHRPRSWAIMVTFYIGAAVWKVISGRLSPSALLKVPVALANGRAIGRRPLPPLNGRNDGE
jgi:GT2 family glycosyltransferase